MKKKTRTVPAAVIWNELLEENKQTIRIFIQENSKSNDAVFFLENVQLNVVSRKGNSVSFCRENEYLKHIKPTICIALFFC